MKIELVRDVNGYQNLTKRWIEVKTGSKTRSRQQPKRQNVSLTTPRLKGKAKQFNDISVRTTPISLSVKSFKYPSSSITYIHGCVGVTLTPKCETHIHLWKDAMLTPPLNSSVEGE
jgi:hypothetical protein